jgi:hypothetical protein
MVSPAGPRQPEGMDDNSRLANVITISTAILIVVVGAVLIASV